MLSMLKTFGMAAGCGVVYFLNILHGIGLPDARGEIITDKKFVMVLH
jgi:hypothetical protein